MLAMTMVHLPINEDKSGNAEHNHFPRFSISFWRRGSMFTITSIHKSLSLAFPSLTHQSHNISHANKLRTPERHAKCTNTDVISF